MTSISDSSPGMKVEEPTQTVPEPTSPFILEDSAEETENSTQTTSSGKKQTSGGGIFRRAYGAIREWIALQRGISALSVQVMKNDWVIQELLNVYRMALTTVSFKSQKLDEEIWSRYKQSCDDAPPLRQRTRKSPLFLRRRQVLRELHLDWTQLLEDQQYLIETLDKAPKTIEFYNRIHLARIRKNEQEVRDKEVATRSAAAKESIEKALSLIDNLELRTEGPTLGTGILKLEDAHNYWVTRLHEVSSLEVSSSMDPDEIVHIYRNLETSIQDAPRMAEMVREMETGFARLMNMHESLSAFGKNIIPAEEMARMLFIVQDDVPKLWSTASWDKLRRTLEEVSNFVKFYELPVKSELSLAERRKPSLTRSLLGGTGALPISQVTPLVRTLVSAIDARDKYMAGHSDAVARLSLQVARKMNWGGEDLEYLELAALLHDVGKIAIPEMLLTKQDPLSPDDWKAIQSHPMHGARIVKSIESLNRIAPWIYHHQERWDGKGYPDGVSSSEIPAAARIIGVGEAFTAMTTDQPKRKGLSFGDAISEISKGAGSQFDPEAAGALIQTLETNDPQQVLGRSG